MGATRAKPDPSRPNVMFRDKSGRPDFGASGPSAWRTGPNGVTARLKENLSTNSRATGK
jgi:hypothetical protein